MSVSPRYFSTDSSAGRSLILERMKFVSQLNEILSEIHKQLTGGKEAIELIYEPNVEADHFEKHLQKAEKKICNCGHHP